MATSGAIEENGWFMLDIISCTINLLACSEFIWFIAISKFRTKSFITDLDAEVFGVEETQAALCAVGRGVAGAAEVQEVGDTDIGDVATTVDRVARPTRRAIVFTGLGARGTIRTGDAVAAEAVFVAGARVSDGAGLNRVSLGVERGHSAVVRDACCIPKAAPVPVQ